MEAFEEVLSYPLRDYYNSGTLKAVVIALIIYAVAVGVTETHKKEPQTAAQCTDLGVGRAKYVCFQIKVLPLRGTDAVTVNHIDGSPASAPRRLITLWYRVWAQSWPPQGLT